MKTDVFGHSVLHLRMLMPVESKEDLLQTLKAHKDEIKSFGVSALGVFGSFAKATNIHAQSDVDFLVQFDAAKKTYDNFFDLSVYLEGLLNRKVELITPESLSPYIGPHILKQVVHVAL